MVRKLIFILLGLTFSIGTLRANHLVGGELRFQCRGNNNFEFVISVYRDQPALSPGNDDATSFIFIYDMDNPSAPPRIQSLGQTNNNGFSVVANTIECAQIEPPEVLTNRKNYRSNSINLPTNANGYRVVYQRCCRNTNIINVPQTISGGQGSTYEVFLTRKSLEACSGATGQPILQFAERPPVRFCLDTPTEIDQSVDASILSIVDSVNYFLCSPLNGASPGCPIVDGTGAGGCPQYPFNIQNVSFASGYSATQPLGATSIINIDRSTGQLFVLPRDIQGLFVVNICAIAYKDGLVYSNLSRDLQYSIFDCGKFDAGTPDVTGGTENVGGISNTDTSYYIYCENLEVDFTVDLEGVTTFYWDFGDLTTDADSSLFPNPTYTYPDVGEYLVTFIKDKGLQCVDTSYSVVKIFPSFTADFVFDAGCFVNPVEFVDLSISTLVGNEVESINWDFGDGNSSSDQNPEHQYSADGSYDVTFTLVSKLGCRDSVTKQVVTLPSPSADFDNLKTCTDQLHEFENLGNLNGTQLLNYSWDFGDGSGYSLTNTSASNVTFTYNTPGFYDIQFALSSTSGCSDTARKQIEVIESVSADFNFSPTQICPGQQIQFNNTSVANFDSVVWHIDNNTILNDNPTYAYNAPGSKPVSLVIFSEEICKDSIAKDVPIQNGPFADFSVDSTCVGANYTFNNNSIDNGFAIDNYVWSFGDGNSQNNFQPTHSYQAEGAFNVVLVVSSNLVACSDTAEMTIDVKGGIFPEFSFLPDTICESMTTVQFTNETTGGAYDSIHWDLGLTDANSNEENPSFLYEEGDNYDVTLSVIDDICGVNFITKPITVLDVPLVRLQDSVNICDAQRVRVSTEGNDAYDILWSTGSTANNVVIDNSTDTLILQVDNRGCVSADTLLVVRDCPAFLPTSFTPNNDGVNDLFNALDYNIVSFNLKIFDRWGQKVFETDSFTRSWNGDFDNGTPAPLGVYTYIIEGIGLDEKELKQTGVVMLMR